MNRLFLWAVLLSFTSCGGRGDFYTVYVDPAFTPAQDEAIVAALESWEDAAPVSLQPVVGPCSGVHDGQVCIHASDHAGLMSRGAPTDEAVGLDAYREHIDGTRIDGGEIYIDVPAFESVDGGIAGYFQQTVAHEVGHAMGLMHTGEGSLMAPLLQDGNGVPTCTDVLQWYALRGEPNARCQNR